MEPAQLLAAAHQAMTKGDDATALRLAQAAIAQAPAHAPARQLAAVAARRLGQDDLAQTHIEAALSIAPRDPHILNSHGNLLFGREDVAGARAAYEASLAVLPEQPETLVNLALACQRLGDRTGARTALEAALARAPTHARALHALGLMQSEDGELDAAAETLDRALAASPQDVRILAARGQVESDVGGTPTPFFQRARAIAPQDRELVHGHAIALLKAGEPAAAEALLEPLVAAHPDFVAAHETLAHLRAQNGQAARFCESFEDALRTRPQDPQLWWSLLGLLMRAGQPQAVLDRLDAARPVLGDACRGLEAAAATEAGDLPRADAAFAGLDPAADPGLRVAYLRHLLRSGRPEAAAALALAAAGSGAADAWPYLATAWRLLGDPRAQWLEEDPAFIAAYDLPISGDELAALAAVLRTLHSSRAAPPDQTLRGGTQTEGSLLSRRLPEIAKLRDHLGEAVATYIANLPPPDPAHPLLRAQREGFRFAGSWSVRLLGAGFHVNHVHTTGWISSACYVAVPGEIGRGDGDTSGWLTFGAPPAELGLDLRPFRKIEPRPGRLALFPSTMWHGTEPFTAGERLTVAFDIIPAT